MLFQVLSVSTLGETSNNVAHESYPFPSITKVVVSFPVFVIVDLTTSSSPASASEINDAVIPTVAVEGLAAPPITLIFTFHVSFDVFL